MSAGDRDVSVCLVGKGNSPDLSSIYGSDSFKQELEDIILAIQNPMLYGMFGIDPMKSFLFYGPPGTGKTMAVKSIIHELANRSDEQKLVAFMQYDIGKYGTAYINMGAVNLQRFFDAGAQVAMDPKVGYVIYWFDECESLMSPRQGGGSKEDDKVLNTLMTNLQGINDRGLPEYLFFATNFPDALDMASVRSGRINYKVEFKLPDKDNRRRILEGLIAEKNKRVSYQFFRSYDLDKLVSLTDGMSCADLSAGVDRIVAEKIKKELRVKGKGIVPAYYVTHKAMEEGLMKISAQNKQTKKTRIGFIKDD